MKKPLNPVRPLLATILLMLALHPAQAQEKSKISSDAEAYIISPADGAVVSSPVTVVFGLRGAGIAPAGVTLENTGHHHLIIDAPLPDIDAPIPSDDNHRHFGKGQTEASIELPPGRHTLQLLLGDGLHIPHDNVVASAPITITVE